MSGTHATKTLATLLASACTLLVACTPSEPHVGDHRLVGIWDAVDGPDDRPPSTQAEWRVALDHEEATYSQTLILRDGTMVFGGLLLGHTSSFELTWEVLEESGARVVLGSSTNGRPSPPTVLQFVSKDLIRMDPPGTSDARLFMRRVRHLGPFPSLEKYRDRL